MVSTSSKASQSGGGQDRFVESMNQRGLFLNMALNMSWQLAIVVLLPIVGGYELDKHFKTLPWLTVIGTVVAALGVIALLRQIVKEAAVRVSNPKKVGHK